MKTIVQLVEEQKEYFLEKDTAAKQAVEANIAPVEADASSASRAYVVGEQLILNDVLYDVTSPISVGDAIAVGTNITAANKLSADIQTLTNKLNNEAATRSAMGAKNLIPFDLASIKAKNSQDYPSGSWNNNEWTINGVTFAIQDDNTVIATGANTSNSNAQLDYYITIEAGVSYIANGCPSGGSNSTYRIANYCSTSPTETFSDIGNGVAITRAADTTIIVHMQVKAGYTIDGQLVFKPMIRLATDSDATYQPYAKTNQQLTKDTTALLDNLEVNGAVNMFDNILTSQVINGITYTVNDDGSVTCNGTATANGGVMLGGIAVKSGKAYKISGCPSGGDADNSYALIVRTTNSTSAPVIGSDIGNGFIYTPTSDTTVYLQIRFASGQTANNLTFKPMITVLSYNGDYVPHAKSNKELTENIASIHSGDITDSYLIKDGTLNIYMTSDTQPDLDNLSTQDATDIAQGLYDLYKKLGGVPNTIYHGYLTLRFCKKSDKSQLGSLSGVYDFFNSANTYDDILANNSRARIICQISEYGNPVHTEFGVWASSLTAFKYGINNAGTSFDIRERTPNIGTINSFIG